MVIKESTCPPQGAHSSPGRQTYKGLRCDGWACSRDLGHGVEGEEASYHLGRSQGRSDATEHLGQDWEKKPRSTGNIEGKVWMQRQGAHESTQALWGHHGTQWLPLWVSDGECGKRVCSELGYLSLWGNVEKLGLWMCIYAWRKC